MENIEFKTIAELMEMDPGEAKQYLYNNMKHAEFRDYINRYQDTLAVKALNDRIKAHRPAPTIKEFVEKKEEALEKEQSGLIFKIKRFFYKRYAIAEMFFKRRMYRKAFVESIFNAKRYGLRDKKWGERKK